MMVVESIRKALVPIHKEGYPFIVIGVVATLVQGGEDEATAAAAPVRVEAVLAPGQSVVLSSPRGAGAPPDAAPAGRCASSVSASGTPSASAISRRVSAFGAQSASARKSCSDAALSSCPSW